MNRKAANKRKKQLKNRNKDLEKIIDYSISGYPTISKWDISPKPPFNISWLSFFRCGNVSVTIEDSNKNEYTFFFDDFLGRLCFGAENNESETAVFIKANSKLEREAFFAIEEAIANEIEKRGEEYYELSLVKKCLEKAKVYVGDKSIIPRYILD